LLSLSLAPAVAAGVTVAFSSLEHAAATSAAAIAIVMAATAPDRIRRINPLLL
jgi:acyl-CoA reductase-like NAD-dependent aldehyde dehydrogenase